MRLDKMVFGKHVLLAVAVASTILAVGGCSSSGDAKDNANFAGKPGAVTDQKSVDDFKAQFDKTHGSAQGPGVTPTNP